MSEIKPLTLISGWGLDVLISDHAKNQRFLDTEELFKTILCAENFFMKFSCTSKKSI